MFTYIGANQNVEKVAATVAINNVMNFNTTSEGTKAMFEKERHFRMRWFDKVSKGIVDDNEFFADDEK